MPALMGGSATPLGRPERIFNAPRYAAGVAALSRRNEAASEHRRAFVRLLRAAPETARPRLILAWLKARPYRSDQELWGMPDYWDDPAGFLAHGGDCEEFAIAAYLLLRESGLPDAALVVVLARIGGAGGLDHAYVVARIGGRSEVIDPLSDRLPARIEPGGESRPIAAFNARQVWLLSGDGWPLTAPALPPATGGKSANRR